MSYKIQRSQMLKQVNRGQRRNFTNWMLAQHKVDKVLQNKLIYSDEEHFHLNIFVRKQNYQISEEENVPANTS